MLRNPHLPEVTKVTPTRMRNGNAGLTWNPRADSTKAANVDVIGRQWWNKVVTRRSILEAYWRK